MHMIVSVAEWLNYSFNVWPFTTKKLCPIANNVQNFANLLIVLNFFNFCQSGEIMANLVTVIVVYKSKICLPHSFLYLSLPKPVPETPPFDRGGGAIVQYGLSYEAVD